MSKKKAQKRHKPKVPQLRGRSRRKTVVLIGLILCLGLSSLILAQWRTIRSSLSPLTSAPTPSPAPQLSKEYIYAGGKLIATEEPSNASTTLSTPINFTANAVATTQVNLSWASTSAPTYLIERSTNYTATNNGFTTLTTIDCTSGCSDPISYTDNVPGNTVITYLYRVRSVSGAQQSSPSLFDFATTKNFTEQIQNQNPPGRTTIRATHFLELQDAVNAVRAAAGLATFTWSDPLGRAPASNVPILKSHMLDLRTGLDEALSHLGFTPAAYTDHGLPAGTFVQKAHIDELRQRTKSVGQ
jgi:hypothetical protein